ncbi:MAG: hypothetical protein EHM40_15920 [Chloroflexi bacterium]|nr:MAG: hypothetical protein EHM40_15920 [Chloroflexota bacterium]
MKNFEEMQSIWKGQNDEKLFAVDNTALHAYIKHKGRTTRSLLELFEWIMIALNLLVGVVLAVDFLRDNGSGYRLILPVTYLAFSAYILLRRLKRQAKEARFKPTLLGELDRAIWQIDYLIRQGQTMMIWYVLPLVLALSITMFYNQKSLWTLVPTLALIPICYFGVRWEINKWYLPKKRDLELLREKLIAQETQS